MVDTRERLSQLKPDERRALILIGGGYSYEEIGAALNWTYSKTNRCAAEGGTRANVCSRRLGSDFFASSPLPSATSGCASRWCLNLEFGGDFTAG